MPDSTPLSQNNENAENQMATLSELSGWLELDKALHISLIHFPFLSLSLSLRGRTGEILNIETCLFILIA